MIDDVAVGWSKGKKGGSIPRSSRVLHVACEKDERLLGLRVSGKNVKKLDARPFSSFKRWWFPSSTFVPCFRVQEIRVAAATDRTWAVREDRILPVSLLKVTEILPPSLLFLAGTERQTTRSSVCPPTHSTKPMEYQDVGGNCRNRWCE